MIRMKTKTKEEFCQSRFYKDWNPDFMADYNRYNLIVSSGASLSSNIEKCGARFFSEKCGK